MLDFTNPKTPQNIASRINSLALVRSGPDESVEPLVIEALHTTYGNTKKNLVISIEPADLSISNSIDIKNSGATINQYGRMDPLQNYSSTERSMNISFKWLKAKFTMEKKQSQIIR